MPTALAAPAADHDRASSAPYKYTEALQRKGAELKAKKAAEEADSEGDGGATEDDGGDGEAAATLTLDEFDSIAASFGRETHVAFDESTAARVARHGGRDDTLTARMREHLRPHQLRSLAHLEQRLTACAPRAGAILADRPGLGKTRTAIVLVTRELRIGRARRCIIAVPAALIQGWCWEFDKAKAPQPATARAGWRPAWESGSGGAIVLSYERLTRDYEFLFESCSPADLLVIDEAHNLAKSDTKRYATAARFPGRRLLISGTPMAGQWQKRAALLGLVATADEMRGGEDDDDDGDGSDKEGELLGRVAIAHDFGALDSAQGVVVPRQLIVEVKLGLDVQQPETYDKTERGRAARKADRTLASAQKRRFACDVALYEVQRGRSVMVCSTRLNDLRGRQDEDLASMRTALVGATTATTSAATAPTSTPAFAVHTLEGANTQDETNAALSALASARAGSGVPIILLVSSSYVTGYNLQGIGCAVMLREENRALMNRQVRGRIRRLDSTETTTVFRPTVACPDDEAQRETVRAGEREQDIADGMEQYYKYKSDKPPAEVKDKQRVLYDPLDRFKAHDGDLHDFVVSSGAEAGSGTAGDTGGAGGGGDPRPNGRVDVTAATWSELTADEANSGNAPPTPGAKTPPAKRGRRGGTTPAAAGAAAGAGAGANESQVDAAHRMDLSGAFRGAVQPG